MIMVMTIKRVVKITVTMTVMKVTFVVTPWNLLLSSCQVLPTHHVFWSFCHLLFKITKIIYERNHHSHLLVIPGQRVSIVIATNSPLWQEARAGKTFFGGDLREES